MNINLNHFFNQLFKVCTHTVQTSLVSQWLIYLRLYKHLSSFKDLIGEIFVRSTGRLWSMNSRTLATIHFIKAMITLWQVVFEGDHHEHIHTCYVVIMSSSSPFHFYKMQWITKWALKCKEMFSVIRDIYSIAWL